MSPRRRVVLQDADNVVTIGKHDYELIPWSNGKFAFVSRDPHGRLRQSSARRRLRRALRDTGITVECVWRRLSDGSGRIIVAVFCWRTRPTSNVKQIQHRIREAFTLSHPAPDLAPATATP